MASTYSGDPSSSNKDMVRFLVMDVHAPFLLTDEEINALLSAMSLRDAASQAARSIGLVYSRKAEQSVGDVSVKWAATAEHYADLSLSIAANASLSVPFPFAGGIYRADKDSTRDDDSLVVPAFTRNDGLAEFDDTAESSIDVE